ncbi:NADPH-dependent FMN reductase [Faecalispora anaeroviscerum]|uniref:NADPH-dependent FMN reductase n=1 Tax=Faecalispora anaeroviscerum TaxID=2991836 RepID=UPI0024B95D08|nr:NAD(P)H-dependent oxidoreductase [Faecalispora anaeroviscerum]
MNTIKLVGFTGSLRKGSYNRGALRAAKELLPEGAELEILDLSAIPFFNQDLEGGELPASVTEFKKKIAEADALLIATPEYNYSIPPVLKNALDWASRDPSRPLSGKPAAIFSVSSSALGGARVQYHLRQVGVALNLKLVNQPEVFISFARDKFDTDGNLKDEDTKKHLSALVNALVDLAKAEK